MVLYEIDHIDNIEYTKLLINISREITWQSQKGDID